MRLIDADAPLSELKKEYEASTLPLEDEDIGFMAGIATAIEAIDGTPTIDPTRHGEWKWDGEEYYCSECFASTYFYGSIAGVLEGNYKFCPNCGARMDGVEENE